MFLKNRLLAHGVEFHWPDLNHPDFSTMTVSRMVEKVQAYVAKRIREHYQGSDVLDEQEVLGELEAWMLDRGEAPEVAPAQVERLR